uniref:CobW C-terminal domain-containing protein n=1 Tax=Spongospora subterranea TaxID=70186 RepID=A0A0H5R8T6_9EUKA|eukprot:CRZ10535.1 hypothetical protein [Spongospora subterranea]
MSSPNPDEIRSVPLTVVGGWLGAGKTTLIREIMSQMMANSMRVALIQNEFSDGGMDKPSLTDSENGQVFDNFVELAQGCICCSVKSDFIGALERLVGMCRFDYMILECSGLADPGEVAAMLWVDQALQVPVHLDGIVTVLDGANLSQQSSNATPNELLSLQRQIAYADRLVLNKTDLISIAEGDSLLSKIKEINITAPVLTTVRGDISYQQLTNLSAYNIKDASVLSSSLCFHDHSITALVLGPYDESFAFNMDKVNQWLGLILWDQLEENPEYPWTIYRIKGIVNSVNDPNRIHIQSVQRLFDCESGLPWTQDDSPFTKLILIGRNLDKAVLYDGLMRCAMPKLQH